MATIKEELLVLGIKASGYYIRHITTTIMIIIMKFIPPGGTKPRGH